MQVITNERTIEKTPRPLSALIPLIHEQYASMKAAAEDAAKPYYERLGELLLEAKAQLTSTEFADWVRRNFEFGRGAADEYMTYVRRLPEFETSGGRPRTLTEVTRPHRDIESEPSTVQRRHVTKIVQKINVDRLSQERQAREKELRLMRQLANQLIDIGYKVLATKLHPDHGGSREAMSRLNEVRRRLKAAI